MTHNNRRFDVNLASLHKITLHGGSVIQFETVDMRAAVWEADGYSQSLGSETANWALVGTTVEGDTVVVPLASIAAYHLR